MTRLSGFHGRSGGTDGGSGGPRFTGRQVTAMVVAAGLAFALHPVAQVVATALDAPASDHLDTSLTSGLGSSTTAGLQAQVGVVSTQLPSAVAGAVSADAPAIDPVQQVVAPDPPAGDVPAAMVCSSLDAAAATAPGASLPALSPALASSLGAYGRNPNDLTEASWMDSGGRFGGGIPAAGVRLFLRRAVAAGVSDDQALALLNNPSFMHAAGDPDGGARLLDFIGDHPELFAQVADFAAGAPFAAGWGATSGQARLFGAFPELGAVYAAMAGAIHASGQDHGTVDELMKIATEGGSWGELASRRLDEVLTFGPRARSADKALARYVAASGYEPVSPEAVAGRAYWLAYSRAVERIQSDLATGPVEDLPAAPTGARTPMALTWPVASTAC
jgi:hypothetical protein